MSLILEEFFIKRPAAEWIAEMDRRGVPCAPINGYAEVLTDPQVKAMGLVLPLVLPNGVKTRTTAFPVKITDYEFTIHYPPPALGADTVDVFAEWLGGGTGDTSA